MSKKTTRKSPAKKKPTSKASPIVKKPVKKKPVAAKAAAKPASRKVAAKKLVTRKPPPKKPPLASGGRGSDPTKHVIVVPPPLAASAAMMGGSALRRGGMMGVAGVGDGAGSLRSVLDSTRQSLLAFAASALGGGDGIGMMGVAGGAAPLRRGARAPAPAAAPKHVQALEALGVLVVDKSKVDVRALADQGATIIENFLVPMELPKPAGKAKSAAGAAASGTPWHLSSINVSAARAKNLTGKDILVGVLDTGVEKGHGEFKGKKVHYAEFDTAGKLVSKTARDFGEHGTHVCGLIAGKTVGVAPDAQLAVAAVLTVSTPKGLSGYLAQILGGMNWLLSTPFTGDEDNPGVDVMNASLGGVGYSAFYYQTLQNARAITGTLLAAAIGNNGRQGINHHGSPGNYDITVGVGAIDQNNDIASFSDWGTVAQHANRTKPDICAPGVAVTSSVPGNKYAQMSGTSMATPVTTGALALLLEQNPQLDVNASALETALYSHVSALTGAANTPRGGRGRLDLTHI
ncbi:MAG: S8 family serine peptidase [Verrucomicrobiaceae bacterium]|nr:S8 family serine peptidase [Verrucomicrobiaceae bacterium]